MIQGIARQRGGKWYVEHSYTLQSEPVRLTIAWEVTGSRRTGPFAPDLADGLHLDSIRDQDAWQAYRQGDYLVLTTVHDGTPTEAPYPCPSVRAGIETRYRDGAWQKHLKAKGWVTA